MDATKGKDIAVVDAQLVKDMDDLGRYVKDKVECCCDRLTVFVVTKNFRSYQWFHEDT